MTVSDSSNLTSLGHNPPSSTTPDFTQARSPRRKPRKMSMERVMVMFTLFFALGILLLVLLPEGHIARGIGMTLYSVAVFWAMFRFGM